MNRNEYEKLIFAELGESFLKKALTGIYVGFREAADYCKSHYGSFEAANLEPHIRRANIEKNVRGTAEMVEGVSVLTERPGGTPWYHIEIAAGSLLLTTSAVQCPGAAVNYAKFRQFNANPQLRFEELEGAAANEPRQQYAVLTYSPFTSSNPEELIKLGHLPGSVYIGFPSPDLKKYLYLDNLLERFPDTVKQHIPVEIDEATLAIYIERSRAVRYRAA